MGLAGGKAKLKLIDIETAPDRGNSRPNLGAAGPRLAPTLGSDPAAGSEIGAMLRAARENLDQDLRDVSRHLRIRHQYLDAIENGAFRTLPGLTYAIGYVRTYAQFLGLDADRAVVLFKAEAQELEGPRELVFPSPAPEGKVPGGAIMFVAAVLAVLAYAGWFHLSTTDRNMADYAPRIPDSLQSWLGQDNPGSGGSEGFTSTAVASTGQGAPVADPPAEDTGPLATAPIAGITAPEAGDPAVVESAATMPAPITPTSVTPAIVTPTIVTPAIVTRDAGSTPDGIARADATASTDSGGDVAVEEVSPRAPRTATVEAAPDETETTPASVALSQPSPPQPPPAEPSRPRPSMNEAFQAQADDVLSPPDLESGVRAAPPRFTTDSGAADDTGLRVIPPAPTMDSLGVTQAHAATIAPDTSASAAVAAPTTTARVVIQASADSWVQVRASDSTTVMTRVMRAGDIYEVPDRQGLHLITGNAGALTILVDGEAIPKLGKAGQIARNIILDPAELKQRVN